MYESNFAYKIALQNKKRIALNETKGAGDECRQPTLQRQVHWGVCMKNCELFITEWEKHLNTIEKWTKYFHGPDSNSNKTNLLLYFNEFICVAHLLCARCSFFSNADLSLFTIADSIILDVLFGHSSVVYDFEN